MTTQDNKETKGTIIQCDLVTKEQEELINGLEETLEKLNDIFFDTFEKTSKTLHLMDSKPYETIKMVFYADRIRDFLRSYRGVQCAMNFTKEDVDEVCEHHKISVDGMALRVMMNSVSDSLEGKSKEEIKNIVSEAVAKVFDMKH